MPDGENRRIETFFVGEPATDSQDTNDLEPATLVIFGASGDLTSRKLAPALYDLFLQRRLPDPFPIVGSGRTKMSSESFRDKLKDAMEAEGRRVMSEWDRFAAHLYYLDTDSDPPAAFENFAEFLRELDGKYDARGNRIFYLALPPSQYAPVAGRIGEAGLSVEGEGNGGWSRIVIEKPFGRDLETALELDRILHENFSERQIFRIDHYLAKETVQNMLVFRLANSIFEPVWNRRYIDSVHITAAETLGVEHRAGYYEQAGVIRDMFQNHMMQLLALTAMEPPSVFEADRVQDEKIKVFRSLRPFPVDRIHEHLILGQYGRGVIDGARVPGYREEPGVEPNSLTPTYALMRANIDNWRWQGVPFYITSGKRLAKKLTEVAIQFKPVPHSMFRNIVGDSIEANRLTLGFQPEEVISLTFQTKSPGVQVRIQPVAMRFDYNQNGGQPRLDAYAKVLLDCIRGDHMLFWRQDGVELSWAFLTPILERCEGCEEREDRLSFYKAGSWGPNEGEK